MDFAEEYSAGSGFKRPDITRPKSRRGYRDQISSLSRQNSVTNMRPTSAYRGGSTSRMSTAGFGPAPTTASRQQTAVTGFSMLDRPITQQGLSGLRTGTARGFRTRQLQDKRYWEEVMQVKVREIKAEISRLNEQAEAGEREKSAKKHYEKRVKELAQELTDLQGRLSDYNTAIRIANGEISKQAVEDQTKELKENNKKIQEEVEQVFIEKQRKDLQLRQLKEQLDKERSTISQLLSEMTTEQKQQYNELEKTAGNLRTEVEQLRSQVDVLNKDKTELTREISGSQIKIHLLELHKKLLEAEEKRDSIKSDLSNRLDPQEEREKLLQQVREDNAAIATLDSNAANLKEQIRNVQELIDQAEQDLEEGNSERHQKYRELKKREETMETFMASYEENLQKEQQKIEQLEKDIVFTLEYSSSNIDLDLSEIDLLKKRDGYLDESKKTVESLTKDYQRYEANLKKVEGTRERLATELQTLPGKTQSMKEELIVLSDLDKLRSDGAEQKKALEVELETLRDKLGPTENAIAQAAHKLSRLQESLNSNEMYVKLNSMEEQLSQLDARKTILEEDIASITLKADYEPIKLEALAQIAALNKLIIADLNPPKNY